jgi:hypothetical protein
VGSTPTSGNNYSIFSDVNGSGGINVTDLLLAQSMVGKSLPAGSPITPLALISPKSNVTKLIAPAASPAAMFSNSLIVPSRSDLLEPMDRLLVKV